MHNLKKINQIIRLITVLCLVFSFSSTSCAAAQRDKEISLTLRKFEEKNSTKAVASQPPKPLEYFLSEDDMLDITVWRYLQPHTKETKGGVREYFISKGDTLEISVWEWPDLLKDVIVRPDGKISYPLVGEIDAEGLTLMQLQKILTERLKDYIKMPQVSIMVKQFGASLYGAGYTGKIIELPFVKIDDLSTTQVVRPDGKIAFPLLGEVEVKGLTVNQLSKNLVEKISAFMKDIQVTIAIKQFGGKKVIVLGEVNSPGVFKPTGEITLLEAIALGQGYTRDAIMNNVILISWDMDKPVVKAYDLVAVMKRGKLSQNVIVHGGDIVYVPRSHISNLNYFLQEFIGPLVTASSTVTPIRTLRAGTSVKH